MDKRFEQTLHQDDKEMVNGHIKRCPTSSAVGKYKSNTMTYHCTPIRMAKIKRTANTKSWPGCGRTEFLIHSW